MESTKISYDEDADVLYISFGRSQHVTGVKLADNILLRVILEKVTKQHHALSVSPLSALNK